MKSPLGADEKLTRIPMVQRVRLNGTSRQNGRYAPNSEVGWQMGNFKPTFRGRLAEDECTLGLATPITLAAAVGSRFHAFVRLGTGQDRLATEIGDGIQFAAFTAVAATRGALVDCGALASVDATSATAEDAVNHHCEDCYHRCRLARHVLSQPKKTDEAIPLIYRPSPHQL
ncbi:hypothetical protein [Blastopirellula marina]|uniref:Uncharacterized protein n=1 Tax=Blastopirellula marina DSM 3645 TaxID=314230 RepID=A3ZMJ2_9BACT|nr:hypothetical protein [Blastopirellula marina]EAQ82165.1 hypothetical protein DSM3645_00585 [Blastopirellula marina DSM 3645]